jgi:hypothetical protein
MHNQSITIPTRPEPLSPTVYHSRAEYRKWREDEAAYWDAVRAAQRQEEQQLQAERAQANRPMDDDEYDRIGLAREAERKAKQLQQEADELRRKREKEEFLASSPESVDIFERNLATFLLDLTHWARKGYDVDLNDHIDMQMNLYSVRMVKAPAEPAVLESSDA